MRDLVRIGEAAILLGVAKATLGRWHESGKFPADVITPGGERRYSRQRLLAFRGEVAEEGRSMTVAYARVSTSEQRPDLDRQADLLSKFCAGNGWAHEVIRDVGSGMNYRKKGLARLLKLLVDGEVARLVLMDKDRLLRFGSELVFSICALRGVEVVIVNGGESQDSSFDEDLAKDVLEIVTVFSARLYGARSRRNRKLIEGLRAAAEA